VHVAIVRPTLVLSEALARFDDNILDRDLHRTARAGIVAASRAARADERGVDGAVEGLARQLRGLGTLARRPQTGKVHQYYAQTTIALAVVFALILLVR
ncbi:MAG: NADH-quinone oxidoreductase subunit L, partial [Demequina sp.]|nr:NADH-quinone oxidoreductase subunit L [Demequina sp.]